MPRVRDITPETAVNRDFPDGAPSSEPGFPVGAACRQDMHDAPRYEAYEASESFPDGRASRTPPAGTVARGWLREDEALYTGRVNGQLVDAIPFAVSHADLRRGQERFNIYCTPCHGRLGDGQGMVVQRGLRQAASYHQDRLRQERIGYFFDVMTNGFGRMPDYRAQISPRDRWNIAAYIRALQLSQHASKGDVEGGDPTKGQKPAAPAAGEHGAPAKH